MFRKPGETFVEAGTAKGRLVAHMEQSWADFWRQAPPQARECPPEALEAFKRIFMGGFACGAKWAQHNRE